MSISVVVPPLIITRPFAVWLGTSGEKGLAMQ